MTTEIQFPETLQETISYFADEQRAFEFVRSFRWADGLARCPECDSTDSYFLPSGNVWKCKACARKYSLKIGTIFEHSPLSLGKWL